MANVQIAGFDKLMANGDWAQIVQMVQGAPATVEKATDWQTRAVAGLDRVVSCPVGSGSIGGALVVSDGSDTVQLDPATSTARIDLVAWRINWNVLGGAAELVKVNGTSAVALPPLPQPTGAPSDPIGYAYGYIPLGLWQVTPGQQMPQLVQDLRPFSSAKVTSASLLGIINPPHGLEVELTTDGTRWRRNALTSSWERVYDRKLWWAGKFNSLAGQSFGNGYPFKYPAVVPDTAFGANTLRVVIGASSRIYLERGAYSIRGWLPGHFGDSAYLLASLDTTTPVGGGQYASAMNNTVLHIPNGATGIYNQTTSGSLIFGWYSNDQLGYMVTAGSQLHIRKEGDL